MDETSVVAIRSSTWITSKIRSIIISQLSVIVDFEKNPQMYSTIPIEPNIKDNDILYAVDKFVLSSNVIEAVVTIITIELRHMLNNAYFDNSILNKTLDINRTHPITITFFMSL